MQIAKRSRLDRSPARKDDDVEPDDEEQRTLFCANLNEQVTEEILYELFIQSGPIESVRIPKDKDGRPRQFGFVTFSHACTVPYALELFRGVRLFNRDLVIKFRNQNSRDIVLGKRRRIDSITLSGEKTPPPRSRSRNEDDRPQDNTKSRFQSDPSNLMRMGGGGGQGGSKRRHDANMQPKSNRNTPNNRTPQSMNQMNINDLEMLGSRLVQNPFKTDQASFNFDNAMQSLLNMHHGSGKRDNDGGGPMMNHGDSQQGNFFRQNKSPRRSNTDSNRGRHGNRDRPPKRRRGGNRR